MNFSIDKNDLVIQVGNQSKTVNFPWPIVKVLEIDSTLIVLVKAPLKTIFNENIYAVDRHGDVIWQIEKRSFAHDDSPYTNLSFENGELILWNWSGPSLVVDHHNGKILEVNPDK